MNTGWNRRAGVYGVGVAVALVLTLAAGTACGQKNASVTAGEAVEARRQQRMREAAQAERYAERVTAGALHPVVNVHFPGGTLAECVDMLRATAGAGKANIVISGEIVGKPVPPMALTNPSLRTAVHGRLRRVTRRLKSSGERENDT